MAYQPTSEDKSTGLICHLLALLTGFLGPLIMYLVKKDTATAFVKLQAKQALVWGAMISIVIVISIPLMIVVIGALLYPAALIVNLVFTIMGMVKTNKGEKFLYPVVAEMFAKDEIAAVWGEGAAAAPAAVPPQKPQA